MLCPMGQYSLMPYTRALRGDDSGDPVVEEIIGWRLICTASELWLVMVDRWVDNSGDQWLVLMFLWLVLSTIVSHGEYCLVIMGV